MIYKFSKPRRFITLFLCSLFSIFIIFVSCSFSFLKVNASVVSTIAEIAFEVLGKDYLEQKIGNFLDKVSDNVTSKQFVVDATSNLNSALMKAVLRAFGISFSSDYNENTFLANALPAGGLLSVPPNEYVDGDVSHNPKLYSELSEYVYDFLKTLTVRQLIDFCDGYNVGIDISPEVLNTISDVLKNHLDIFAYADDRVSNVINDFEDFENTDLSILYNLLSTCDTNSYNIVTCGKGYFCVMGKNYHNANFSYLGSSSSNTLYYFSLNGYIFRMGSNNGNDMDGYISRDFCYFRMNGLNDVCVRRYDKDGHRLSNGYSFSKKNSPNIFSKDGNSYYISEVQGQGYALFDSNDDIVSDYYLTLRECFAYYFLASDVDTFVPSEIDLQYYPNASDAIEEKKIVVNNTYNYNTTTEQVYNYDAVGTLAGTVTDKDNNNTDITTGNGTTNITINNNVGDSSGSGWLKSLWGDYSILDIETYNSLFEATSGYYAWLKDIFSILSGDFSALIGLGLASAIVLRFLGR